jgi:hypothetical protein
MNLSSKELAAASQSQLDGFKNPNKRAMLGAMGINVGNVQEAQGIKSVLQSAIAGQGAQQAAPGGSIVDRMAMAVKAKVDQQKQQQEAMLAQHQERMNAVKNFREDQQRQMAEDGGVGSLPVPDENYAEGGIVPFVKGGQPKAAAKEEDWHEAARREGYEQATDYMAAYPKPEQIDGEAIFNRAFESNQAMGKPFVDKMNELIQKMRPDENGIRATNRSKGIIEAGLQMLQGGGGPGFARGLASIAGGAQRGLNQYQEGEQKLQNQLQKHQAFEMEGIKNELGMRKDDLRYAQGMAEEARKEYGLNSREHTKALVQAGQIQKEVLRLATEAEKIRQKAIADAAKAAATDRRLDIIANKGTGGGGGGGGGGGVASLKDIIQTRREFQQNIKDLSGDTRYIGNLRKSLKTEGISATDLDKAVMDAVENAAAQRTGFANLRDLYSFTGRPEGKVVAPSSATPAAAPQTKPKLKLFE